MQTQSPLLQFSRVTAALILLLFGLIGLLGSRRGSGFDQTIQAEASESLDSQLMEREVMLDRRREAETLLMAFTRAQMTRHYWGEFAASLQELGLPVGHQLETTVERSGGGTRLWIMPRRGTEGISRGGETLERPPQSPTLPWRTCCSGAGLQGAAASGLE